MVFVFNDLVSTYEVVDISLDGFLYITRKKYIKNVTQTLHMHTESYNYSNCITKIYILRIKYIGSTQKYVSGVDEIYFVCKMTLYYSMRQLASH